MTRSRNDQRVVIVGAGFAGFNAARELSKIMGAVQTPRLGLPRGPRRAGGCCEPAQRAHSGPPANLVTRAYHLNAMSGNRTRLLADWPLNLISRPAPESFGLISPASAALDVNRPRA